MPNYKKHLVGGSVAYVILLFLLRSTKPSLITAGEWLIFSLAGSLFPDIDIKSRGQKYFYRIVMLLFILLSVQKQFELLAGCSILAIVPMLVRHRGIFHRWWFIILISMAIWTTISIATPALSRPVFFDLLFFIAGAISHLWLDLGFRRMIWKR